MLVSVAVPVPSLRVLVPLGRRTVTGLVTGTADPGSVAEDAIRELAGVLDDGAPFLPDAIVDLALWVSEYYLAGPGDALSTAMPPFAWVESESRYELTTSGATAVQDASASAKARTGRCSKARCGRSSAQG